MNEADIKIGKWFERLIMSIYVNAGKSIEGKTYIAYLNVMWDRLRPPRFTQEALEKAFGMAVEMQWEKAVPSVNEMLYLLNQITHKEEIDAPFAWLLRMPVDEMQYYGPELEIKATDSEEEKAWKKWAKDVAKTKMYKAGIKGFKRREEMPGLKVLAKVTALYSQGKTPDEVKALIADDIKGIQ